MMKCECSKRTGSAINSYQLFEDISLFFENQVTGNIFSEVALTKPYFIGYMYVVYECTFRN